MNEWHLLFFILGLIWFEVVGLRRKLNRLLDLMAANPGSRRLSLKDMVEEFKIEREKRATKKED